MLAFTALLACGLYTAKADEPSAAHVVCLDLPSGNFCDCEADCIDSPAFCACDEAAKCCAKYAANFTPLNRHRLQASPSPDPGTSCSTSADCTAPAFCHGTVNPACETITYTQSLSTQCGAFLAYDTSLTTLALAEQACAANPSCSGVSDLCKGFADDESKKSPSSSLALTPHLSLPPPWSLIAAASHHLCRLQWHV